MTSSGPVVGNDEPVAAVEFVDVELLEFVVDDELELDEEFDVCCFKAASF
jgi:hypothetical protein